VTSVGIYSIVGGPAERAKATTGRGSRLKTTLPGRTLGGNRRFGSRTLRAQVCSLRAVPYWILGRLRAVQGVGPGFHGRDIGCAPHCPKNRGELFMHFVASQDSRQLHAFGPLVRRPAEVNDILRLEGMSGAAASAPFHGCPSPRAHTLTCFRRGTARRAARKSRRNESALRAQ
jgi:hypothetical protein